MAPERFEESVILGDEAIDVLGLGLVGQTIAGVEAGRDVVKGWGEERLECGTTRRIVPGRESTERVAMVGVLAGDEVDAGGVVAGDVVLTGELEGRLDCFGA